MMKIKNKKIATLIERITTFAIYNVNCIADHCDDVNEITQTLRKKNIIAENESIESLLNIDDESFADEIETKLDNMQKMTIESSDKIYDEIVKFANENQSNYASDFFIKNNETNELTAITDLQFLLLLIQYYYDELSDADYNEIMNNSDELISAYNSFIKNNKQ